MSFKTAMNHRAGKEFDSNRRRKSIRLHEYDYSQTGAYFVTICVHNKEQAFGQIKNGETHLSQAGEIVHHEWLRLAEILPAVALDEFVIMPNHVHRIVVLKQAASDKEMTEYRRGLIH